MAGTTPSPDPSDKPATTKRKRYGGRKPILKPELVAAALAELNGNVAAVAKRFKVARQSVAEMIGKRPDLQSVCADAREGMIDTGESSLYRAVKKGEAWAVCFFLKTQGRGRGYVEANPPPIGDAAQRVVFYIPNNGRDTTPPTPVTVDVPPVVPAE